MKKILTIAFNLVISSSLAFILGYWISAPYHSKWGMYRADSHAEWPNNFLSCYVVGLLAGAVIYWLVTSQDERR
jgi:hypothetical protein